jgi:hypothetical protein
VTKASSGRLRRDASNKTIARSPSLRPRKADDDADAMLQRNASFDLSNPKADGYYSFVVVVVVVVLIDFG